MELNIFIFR